MEIAIVVASIAGLVWCALAIGCLFDRHQFKAQLGVQQVELKIPSVLGNLAKAKSRRALWPALLLFAAFHLALAVLI